MNIYNSSTYNFALRYRRTKPVSRISLMFVREYASTMKNDFYLAQFLIITSSVNFLTTRRIVRIKSKPKSKSKQHDYQVRRKSNQFILSDASQFRRKRKYSTERYVLLINIIECVSLKFLLLNFKFKFFIRFKIINTTEGTSWYYLNVI